MTKFWRVENGPVKAGDEVREIIKNVYPIDEEGAEKLNEMGGVRAVIAAGFYVVRKYAVTEAPREK